MKIMSKELESYIRAGYPAIVLTTAEEDRALAMLKDIANKLNKAMPFWSVTKGIQEVVKNYDIMDNHMLSAEVNREQ